MQAKLYISLKERGSPQVVARDDWVRSGCINDANELARLGVVKITQAGLFLLVEPKTLVGTFDSPRLKLQVAPKAPALSEELVKLLDVWRKKLNVEDETKVGFASHSESLWTTFFTLLSAMHREGLPWFYSRKAEASSTPRGRVLFRETMTRLLSKGISHQVVSSSQIRSYFDSLAPALDTVRRRVALHENGTKDVRTRLVRLIDLTGDLSIPIPEAEAQEVFQELIELDSRPALRELCIFCLKILSGDQVSRTSQKIGSGVAEFVDLEKLWESAVQMLLQQHLSEQDECVVLHPLRRSGLTLFNDGGPEIDPDILTFRGQNIQYAVVDAKYSIAGSPSADDVYQLTSYMMRLTCEVGVLAYVSENSDTRTELIGTLDDGRKLFACYLSLAAFDRRSRVLERIFPRISLTVQMA